MDGLQETILKQDKQIQAVHDAEEKYNSTGDLDALIAFWENIWRTGGLIFNGSKWTFRLPDIYIKEKRYKDALRILSKIKNPQYSEKKRAYIEKIKKLSAKQQP